MAHTLNGDDVSRLAGAIADHIRHLVIREELSLLTVSQAAALLDRSERWVLDALRAKPARLCGAKVGGGWLIKAADLDTYIEARMDLARIRWRRL